MPVRRHGSIGFAIVDAVDEWDIYQTDEVAAWLRELQDSDPKTAGSWNKWYARMIPPAEQLYEIYLKERAAEEDSQ
jgi:hypothetical protein